MATLRDWLVSTLCNIPSSSAEYGLLLWNDNTNTNTITNTHQYLILTLCNIPSSSAKYGLLWCNAITNTNTNIHQYLLLTLSKIASSSAKYELLWCNLNLLSIQALPFSREWYSKCFCALHTSQILWRHYLLSLYWAPQSFVASRSSSSSWSNLN